MPLDRPSAGPTEPGPDPEALRFDGLQAFRAAVRQCLSLAAEQAWPHMCWCDADFVDWPLGEAAVIDQLNAWAHRGGHVTLLAKNFEALRQQHPRFVAWRRLWSHRIDCRACTRSYPAELPSLLWSPSRVLQRTDTLHSRGTVSEQRQRCASWQDAWQAWRERATPAFPASVLGL